MAVIGPLPDEEHNPIKTKTVLTLPLVPRLRYGLWRWVGSMFTERKPNSDGVYTLAMSLTRVLTLVLFLGCLGVWLIKGVEPPPSMVHTLWGLLGLKGVAKVADTASRKRV